MSAVTFIFVFALGSVVLLVLVPFIVYYFLKSSAAKEGSELNFFERYYKVLGAIAAAVAACMLCYNTVSTAELKEASNNINKEIGCMMEMVADIGLLLDEPSGVAPIKVNGKKEDKELALIVDDDESHLFVVEMNDRKPLMRKMPRFSEKGIEDLESITWDPKQQCYFASTSMRLLGGKEKNKHKLIKFNLPENYLEIGCGEIDPSYTDPREKLIAFLIENGVDVSRKKMEKKGKRPHPFELEVEGIAAYDGKILLGLKWPLKGGEAILLRYDYEQDKFDKFLTLDLGGKGISDITYFGKDYLLVAANPPEKADDDENKEIKRYYGKSEIFIYEIIGGIDESKFEYKNKLESSASKEKLKIEGIAIIDKNIWLTYDGPSSGKKIFKYDAVDYLGLDH